MAQQAPGLLGRTALRHAFRDHSVKRAFMRIRVHHFRPDSYQSPSYCFADGAITALCIRQADIVAFPVASNRAKR